MGDLALLPPQASSFAAEIDAIYLILWALTLFFASTVFALVLLFAWRYRVGSKVDRSNPKHHDLKIELAWTVPPIFLALGMFFWNARVYARMYSAPPPDAMEVFVIGKQWMWHAQHSNGVRENNELHVPVGRPIKLTMISQDVIHSFYVPAFRIKRDVIPGRYNVVWFTPTKPGKYHLFCAEYCGKEHSMMIGSVYVMDPNDFQAWLEQGGEKAAARGKTLEQLGEALYKQLACNSCHGPTDTRRGPSLYGLYKRQVKLQDGSRVLADEAYIRESILRPNDRLTYGYEPLMNMYQGQITEEQVLQLIAYIKTLQPYGSAGTIPPAQQAPAPTAERGGRTSTEATPNPARQPASPVTQPATN